MFHFIDKLRLKPENIKKQVAFLIALVLSGIIFVFWFSTNYSDWNRNKEKQKEVSKIEVSPLSNFSDNFSDGLRDIKEQFLKIKDSTSSFSEDLNHESTNIDTSTPNLVE